MFAKITVEDALKLEDKIFIDVRSPLEFAEGTIPNAINIPILDNDERAVVGTIYKEKGSEDAKIKGVEYVSSKLYSIYNEINSLAKRNKHIIIFCWRGGLRSGTVSNFLGSLGINVYQLEGGYKQYRKRVIEYFDKVHLNHSFIVLHGYTGVGKTEILQKLKEANVPILNLEELTKNSGSVFGKLGYINEKPVTQKMFDALAFETLRQSNNKYIVVESEGQRLGSITLPEGLFNSISNGVQILLKTSIDNRVDRLVNDYVNKIPDGDALLEQAIYNLKKRLGLEKVNQYIEWIKHKDYAKVARDLIIVYYDPLYVYSIKKYDYLMEIDYTNIAEAIDKIFKLYHNLENKLM